MSYFTSSQANSSNIVRAERISKDGEHSHWIFGIEDEYGFYYDWQDSSLGATASTIEQKVSIHDYLVNNIEKQIPRPVLQIENSDIVGESVGATGI